MMIRESMMIKSEILGAIPSNQPMKKRRYFTSTLCWSQHHSHRTNSCMAAAGPAKEYASHAGIVEACEGSEEPIALRASPIPLFLDDP
jgi:hypothetical protein